MSPSAKIESLIAENFTVFTFKAITTDINKHGIEKKTPLGMPVWKQINRDNFRNYIDTQNDMGTAIITGKMSGISVIDFDLIQGIIVLSCVDKCVSAFGYLLSSS
jgi:hypothetical protein